MSGNRNDTLGLYISIPFCRSKCTYCNFASGVYPAGDRTRYVDRLIDDLAKAVARAEAMAAELPRKVDTVYLGGGTPSLLEPELLRRLFAAIRCRFELEPGAEITAECAPGQLPAETLAALVDSGVNRVSLGVQSFIDSEARATGRLHSRAVVESDLSALRAARIANINVDLIAGLPGQTFASWQQSLEVLAASGVPHASIYMLEVDEDSRLGREIGSGGARYGACLVPSDEAIAGMYEAAVERLAQAGLHQYEISNFCRPGFASRHNLRYWQRRPYLGLGLDAASMLFAALDSRSGQQPPPVLRWTTTDNLTEFLRGGESVEVERLSPARQHEEAWFLGLRLNAGVELPALKREFGVRMVAPARIAAQRLQEDGLLAFDGTHARLTPLGRLLSNEVFREFLDLESDEQAAEPAQPEAVRQP